MRDFYVDPDTRSNFVPLLTGIGLGDTVGFLAGLLVGIVVAWRALG